MITTFIILMFVVVAWKGLFKGGLLGLTAFHVTANSTMTAYWGGGLKGFLTAQWMGVPFFAEHLVMLLCIVALVGFIKTKQMETEKV